MLVVLGYLVWRTDARHRPGLLVGTGLLIYGAARFSLEWFRQPDRGLEHLSWGLTMGQTLSVPILVAGAYLAARSFRRPAVAYVGKAPPRPAANSARFPESGAVVKMTKSS